MLTSFLKNEEEEDFSFTINEYIGDFELDAEPFKLITATNVSY